MTFLLFYLIAINILSFTAFAADKFFAIHHMWRISEFTLLLLCVAGGSPGGFLSMEIFRHKTKHPKFKFGVPAILFIQVTILLLLISYTGF